MWPPASPDETDYQIVNKAATRLVLERPLNMMANSESSMLNYLMSLYHHRSAVYKLIFSSSDEVDPLGENNIDNTNNL